MFMDVGDVFNDNFEWKKGVGIGICWILFVGFIWFDFVWGLDVVLGDEFKIYFILGFEL